MLTLGFHSRTVVIDSRTKTVRIRVRYLCAFWKYHTIAFNQVAFVTYGMRETGETTSYITGEREGSMNFVDLVCYRIGVPLGP